ncbi:PREDICTED: uncharacterized protein LOC109186548 isoform X2 [Ipomoea nil]|uniref:uncharacterized protein LOC109186548 isoform X2 n=1 Tax=Ipomoea nil TaxID=35883 RepID=UPI0009012E4C|nr:PREDICTED: uncharacterized protein LOC109186548 isoform X2 [Ipomoea nil]
MGDKFGVDDQSLRETRSGSKIMVGEKRESMEVEERSELRHKRVKMRDLESVFRSEERNGRDAIALDLNATLGSSCNGVSGDDIAADVDRRDREASFKFRRFGLDLNKEVVSSSLNHDPFCPSKDGENGESRDEFECASSFAPLGSKDSSFRAWNEMKQNGFCSYSHASIQVPKPHGRKSRNEGIMEKKKIELAKKECMDQFAKIAAPSGLLNGLNPGIINHVRNRKQVHSIIEALVRSEKHESQRTRGKRKDLVESTNRNDVFNEPASFPTSVLDLTTYPSNFYGHCKDDMLSLKLSLASTIISDNTSSLSNDETPNPTSVTSLSIKAANVASQWLELLNQDVKGRLAALRRSRKRVQAVIQTEFPCLISKDFGSNQENESCSANSSIVQCDNSTATAHHARWSALFDQMDKSLLEEESQLESLQEKVREMQLQCEHGLLKYEVSAFPIPNEHKLDKASERDLAVRAAAASIYSTCNFLSSMENLPCFRTIP